MEYSCYLLAVIGVFYALGRGFTILLLPESLRRYTLIVAPWTGYCYVALACWPVFYNGGQIDRHIAEVILIAPVLCLAIELFRKRRVKLVRAIVHVPTLGAIRRERAGQVAIRYWKGSDHSKRVSRGRSKTIFAWG